MDVDRLATEDIRLYLSGYLRRHVTNGVLPESLDIIACLESLVLKADSMFLWAKLMMA